MTINQLAEKRKKWVDANRENGFEEGIKHLLSDLYPDNAHFIYELLQNAEDTGASEVRFVLTRDKVMFEHNGHLLFSLDDVDAITSIGFSTKKDDPTKIGKFGIGFKAVFAYTSTPEIESGEYHFKIRDLVVPDTEGLPPASLGECRTRFVLPFDNPNKPPEKAREEIEKNLRELNEGSLLFLSNIQTIKYHFSDSSESGYLELKERDTDGNRIEVSIKRPEVIIPRSTYYLRFAKDVTVEDTDGVKHCRIAVAFGMEKHEDRDWKITPLDEGHVCIYFPAAKEASNLLFHLHAPFASTVARDSVRDDPANVELVDHLADLVAESMSTIRDRGLLDVEFLATLPNDTDPLPSFYLPISERLIEVFNTEKLTPTKQGNHAPASSLYRGSHRLINLIDDQDLATIRGLDSTVSLWAAIPHLSQQRDTKSGQFVEDRKIKHQNERIRSFLDMLDICDWGIDDFIKLFRYDSERRMRWLRGKQASWHQKLYEWLGASVSSATSQPRNVVRERIDKLSSLSIVRCCDGVYRAGCECYFPSDETEHGDDFHYVAKGVYTSGTDTDQQKAARKFLEDIDVSEVGEVERVEAILKQRYVKGTIEIRKNHHKEDIERFISLVEKNPDKKSMFRDFLIFEIDKDRDNKSWWRTPDGTFLDLPYLETGLKEYYEILDSTSKKRKWALSPRYQELGLDAQRLGKFAQAVGAKVQLRVTEQEIPLNHPEWKTHFQHTAAQRITSTSINSDYSIPEFKDLLENPTIGRSKLIWRTMYIQKDRVLKARFRPNQNHETCKANSSLVHVLKEKAWVPQRYEDSISFTLPCDATSRYLPEGFKYVSSWAWLKAIKFDTTTSARKSENSQLRQHAKKMGFDSVDEAETMAGIVKDLKAQGKSTADLEDLVGQMHHDRQRRQRLIIDDLIHAGEKQYEVRARSINTSRDSIDPKTYLRARYTTRMNDVECQMCEERMPFKKRNSDEDYFEAVEALNKIYFPKEHEAQYLALCPECAAKFKEYVKRNTRENAQEHLNRKLKESKGPKVSLDLRDFIIDIQFAEKHLEDLKTVLYYYENIYEGEN